MAKIILDKAIVEQLQGDSIQGIHIRDFISLDIMPNGEYTTDIEGVDLDASYIQAVSQGLTQWFNGLKSDFDWYSKIDNDWINIHFDDLKTNY